MVKIALFCSAGMSTSLLVEKMKKAAAAKGVDVEINAYPEAEMSNHADKVDIALLGPQVRFMLSKAEGIFNPKGVKVAVINTVDYGMMKGDKVLDDALAMLDK